MSPKRVHVLGAELVLRQIGRRALAVAEHVGDRVEGGAHHAGGIFAKAREVHVDWILAVVVGGLGLQERAPRLLALGGRP